MKKYFFVLFLISSIMLSLQSTYAQTAQMGPPFPSAPTPPVVEPAPQPPTVVQSATITTITSPTISATWKKGTSQTITWTWNKNNFPSDTIISGYLMNDVDSNSRKLFANVRGNKKTFTVPTTYLPDDTYHIFLKFESPRYKSIISTTEGLATITISSPHNPIGAFEAANCSVVSGWTCDQNDFSRPINVDVYIGGPIGTGKHLLTSSANVTKAAITKCGGNTAHGFDIPTPASLKNKQTHDIYVYGINIGPGTNKLLGHKKMG